MSKQWLDPSSIRETYRLELFELLDACKKGLPVYHPDNLETPLKYEISLNKGKVDLISRKRIPPIPAKAGELFLGWMLPPVYYLPDLVFKAKDIENFFMIISPVPLSTINEAPPVKTSGRFFDKEKTRCDIHKAASLLNVTLRQAQKLCNNEELSASKAGVSKNARWIIEVKSVHALLEKWRSRSDI